MTQLNGVLTLFDIRDVERFATRTLDDWLRAKNATLRPEDHADATAHLIATTWELAQLYENKRHHKHSFSTYAHRIIRLRIVDFYRARFSDQRFGGDQRRNIDFALPLDAPAPNSDTGTLGGSVPIHDRRLTADRTTLVEWLERTRDSERTRDLQTIREGLCEHTAA